MFNLEPQVIVFDTEFTTWEGAIQREWSGPGEYREIVQIGAIKLETSVFTEVDSFNVLIKPVKNPVLSGYFVNLTRITQEAVDRDGVTLNEALDRFFMWSRDLPLYSWGNDAGVVSENADLLKINFPFREDQFHDIRPVFSEAGVAVKDYMSSTIPSAFGKPLLHEAHDALNDARSIADGLRGLKEAGKMS